MRTAMLAMLVYSAAAFLADADKEHPVTKVVNMLKKMQETMQEEAAKDQEVYEKMSCWCETNDKETNAAVEAAQRAISELTAKIEENAALAARLETEIEELESEIKSAEEAIATATALREKEHAEFSAEEKEMVDTISALTDAIAVLSKHNFLSVKTSLASIKAGHLEGMKQRALALLQQPAGYKSYNSRSGEIFGILKTMKETFETNLAKTRADEAAAQKMFDELVAEKTAGINAAKERKNTKVTELSEAKVALVQAKADLKDVRSNLDADTKFLVDLKEKCSASDKEFMERQKSRQEELVAVGEALKMLTDDSARDLFSSTLGFVQLRELRSVTRKQLVEKLQKAAKKTGSPKLALLAQTAQLDAFTKVKAAIDEMIAELNTQQKDEVTHRDWCTEELRKNDVAHQAKTWEAEDLTKEVNVLADKIATLDEEIKVLTEAVAENKRQIKRASEDREAANAVFQQTIADQRATVAILSKVLARLQKVYEPDAAAAKTAPKAFLQQRQPQVKLGSRTADAAPDGFGQKGGQKQEAGGVLGLIRMCISDAERLQKETIDAEQTAQTDYTKLVKDSSAEIAADNTSINDKTAERAQAEVDASEAQAGLEAANAAMADLEKYATGVHASCDFVLDNFDIRQKARAEEIDALEDAKAILSGADFQ